MGRRHLKGFACCIAEHVSWRTPHLVGVLQSSPLEVATYDFLAGTLRPDWVAIYRNTRVLITTQRMVARWIADRRVPALTRCTATLRRVPATERPFHQVIDGFGRRAPDIPWIEVVAKLVDERGVAHVAVDYVAGGVGWREHSDEMAARGAPIVRIPHPVSGHLWPEWDRKPGLYPRLTL